MESSILDLCTLELHQAKKQVAQSYRAIRSERARSLFRALVRPYFRSVQRNLTHQLTNIGICAISRMDLERASLFGEKLDIRCVGVLIIDDHIPADLATETIASLTVVGILSASQDFFEAVEDRVRVGIRLIV